MKKFAVICLCLTLVVGAYLGMTHKSVPVAEANKHMAAKTYKGTIYVAGMGGHFAAASVTVDPSNADSPIKLDSIDRVVIGTKDTHPTHDPRIDANDPNKMYWSTYKPDKAVDATMRTVHVGVSDLKTGNVIKDLAVKIDDQADEATGKRSVFCASGQSKDYFMPVTMTDLPYIEIFKKDMSGPGKRVFLDQYKKGQTFFYHGTNDSQMKNFVLAVNRMGEDGKPNGKVDMHMLDLKELEKGNVKVLKSGNLSGQPGKTLTFRQDFTPDGKLLLQSAGDRFFLLDSDLKQLDEKTMRAGEENHDAITTPDGKYAVLTLRVSVGEEKDGQLQLYDIEKKQMVGKPTSVCFSCHTNAGIHGNAVLCGADAVWK